MTKTSVSVLISALTLAVLVFVQANVAGCAGRHAAAPHDDDVYGSRAYGYFLDGNMPLAAETYKKGYVSARKADRGHAAARYLSNIGRVYYEMGMLDSAVLYHRKAYDEFKADGDGAHASTAAAFLALCLAGGGDGDGAHEWLGTAASAATAEQKDGGHYLSVIRAIIDRRIAEKISDESAVDAALAYYKKKNEPRMLSTIYIIKADNETARGAYAAAAGYLDEALNAIETSRERYKRSRILLRHAAIKFLSGDEGAARRYYERAADCAPKGVKIPSIDEITTLYPGKNP
jgi:hypothetical protein